MAFHSSTATGEPNNFRLPSPEEPMDSRSPSPDADHSSDYTNLEVLAYLKSLIHILEKYDATNYNAAQHFQDEVAEADDQHIAADKFWSEKQYEEVEPLTNTFATDPEKLELWTIIRGMLDEMLEDSCTRSPLRKEDHAEDHPAAKVSAKIDELLELVRNVDNAQSAAYDGHGDDQEN